MGVIKNSFLHRVVVLFFLMLIIRTVMAEGAIGWHWYNEIYPEESKNKIVYNNNEKNEKSKKENTAAVQMLLLRKMVREAKAKAILYPTEDNIREYITMQNFVVSKAAVFTKIWKRTLLNNPGLDYSILHPSQNSVQSVLRAEVMKKESEAIKVFSKKYGLFFFYRGRSELDKMLAPTIKSFSDTHAISIIPVSIDGIKLSIFPNTRVNNGHAEKLGIRYFPALILVDPKNQQIRPLHYGFISYSELGTRFLQIATNFEEGM